jgi:hypothetical protein
VVVSCVGVAVTAAPARATREVPARGVVPACAHAVCSARPAHAASGSARRAVPPAPSGGGPAPTPPAGPVRHNNVPKPTPPGGDVAPFVVAPSLTAASAPTVAVIGDSVARDYAYYLARVLGPYARVVDGALGGCPAGALPLVMAFPGFRAPLRGGECPPLVPRKQTALVREFGPRVVVWHSVNEAWDLAAKGGRAGSPLWRRRTLAAWDDTLRRVTARGATVVLVLPLWFEHATRTAPDVDRLRALYTEWAGRHRDKVTLADVAPVACPHGPPCEPVNGVDFRPDTTHFDDPGGMQVALYLATTVPALLHCCRPGGRPPEPPM